MKILIAGYYGFGNLGDELILSTMVSQIKKRFPQSVISVLSAAPELTANRHKITAVPRWNLFSVLLALWQHDVFVLGGGGLIQNKTSNRSLLYYLSLIALARLLQNAIVLYSVGVESLHGRFWEKTLRFLLSGRRVFISVRDRESKEFFQRIGFPSQKVFLVADPVFSRVVEHRSVERYTGGPLQLLLIPRYPAPSESKNLFERIAQILIEERGVAVKGTVFQPSVEFSFLSSTVLRMVPMVDHQIFENDPVSMSFTDFVVSARFHGLVLASITGKPFLGVGDPDKNRRLCNTLGMPFLSWDASDSDIRIALDQLLQMKGPINLDSVRDFHEAANSVWEHVFL